MFSSGKEQAGGRGTGQQFSLIWPLVANGALYECMWLAAVLAEQIYVVLLTLVFLLLHFFVIFPARLNTFNPNLSPADVKKALLAEGGLVMVIAAVGYLLDCVWFETGVLQSSLAYPLAPLWLLCLWLAFATTFNTALLVLQRRWFLACVIGAVAGALTYLSGAALNGSVDVGVDHLFFIVILGAVWLLVFPSMLWFAGRWSIWFGYGAQKMCLR